MKKISKANKISIRSAQINLIDQNGTIVKQHGNIRALKKSIF